MSAFPELSLFTASEAPLSLKRGVRELARSGVVGNDQNLLSASAGATMPPEMTGLGTSGSHLGWGLLPQTENLNSLPGG